MAKRVLIVDDSPMIHNIMKKFLIELGFEIAGDAKNGQEAVDLFKQENPDLIFMDVTMPVKDGLEASQEIKVISPNIPIIMLTAMGDDEILEMAKSIGIDVFLKKPFNKEKIQGALEELSFL
jgi:two-component system chemotaxis response regulator CheY